MIANELLGQGLSEVVAQSELQVKGATVLMLMVEVTGVISYLASTFIFFLN